jgi:hypothetical protein
MAVGSLRDWARLLGDEQRLERAELWLALRRWQKKAPARASGGDMKNYVDLLRQLSKLDLNPLDAGDRARLYDIEHELEALRPRVEEIQNQMSLFTQLRPVDPERVRQAHFQESVINWLIEATERFVDAQGHPWSVEVLTLPSRRGDPHLPARVRVYSPERSCVVYVSYHICAIANDVYARTGDTQVANVGVIALLEPPGVLQSISVCDAVIAAAYYKSRETSAERLAVKAAELPLAEYPDALLQTLQTPVLERPTALQWIVCVSSTDMETLLLELGGKRRRASETDTTGPRPSLAESESTPPDVTGPIAAGASLAVTTPRRGGVLRSSIKRRK